MIKATMTVRLHAANVLGAQIASVLRRTAGLDLEERNKVTTAGGYVRLEDLKKEGRLYLADFAASRSTSGPVKVSKKAKVSPFVYNPDQLPGEEIAVLFVPTTGHFFVQSGHLKITQIFEYIKGCSDGGIPHDAEVNPVPNQEKVEEFEKAGKRIKKAVISLKPAVLAHNQQLEGNDAVKSLLTVGRDVNAGQVNVEFLAPKSGGVLGLGPDMMRIAKTVFRANWDANWVAPDTEESRNIQEGIPKMQIRFIDSDHNSTVLDLLKLLIEGEFEVHTNTKEMRYPREERYQALRMAYGRWRHLLVPQ